MKVLMSGGGTGGHIFPAVAIAQEIKNVSLMQNFLFIGANGKMEMEKVPQAGFKIKGIEHCGIRQRKFTEKHRFAIQIDFEFN